MVKMEPG